MEVFFADVIVPLSLPKYLTYRLPIELNRIAGIGCRVIVTVKGKFYTGIIQHIHQQPPENYQALYITSLLDESPIISKHQLELWKWISAYYLCTPGDVLVAAMPSYLRISSDTVIVLTELRLNNIELTDFEQLIIDSLSQRKSLLIAEIEKLLNKSTVMQHVRSLIDKGIVEIKQELRELYRPKQESFISISPNFTEEKLGEYINRIDKKAPKQVDIVLTMLRFAGKTPIHEIEVSKKSLINEYSLSESALKSLIDNGVLTLVVREVGRFTAKTISKGKAELNVEQQKALLEIENHFKKNRPVLLWGQTSSGKTEVYIHLIEKLIQGERSEVLYLLPEIAITTQIISRMVKVFGNKIMVYHSRMSQNERVDVWREMFNRRQNGESAIVVGPRSALFLPFDSLKLIIVDEEHDANYRQNESPRYQARDTALVLSRMIGANILLGTATPSIESWYNVQQQKYELVNLSSRFGGVSLPNIELVDIKDLTKRKLMKSVFSPQLLDEIQKTVSDGLQVLLFQNRRGFSIWLECEQCNWVPQCPNCDVSLTYHRNVGKVICHYCGYNAVSPETCKSCGSTHIKTIGFGTEKIEDELQVFFPELKIGRMDLDTTRSRVAYDHIFQEFAEGNLQVLVGTQMISKGLDFEKVGLVGVLNADSLYGHADYRAFERGFQMLVQVSGRAGRRSKTGKVIIQTRNPGHPLLKWVIDNNFLALVERELNERKTFRYPPFINLIRVSIRHADKNLVRSAAFYLADLFRSVLGKRVIGPAEPEIPRLRNQFYMQFMIKAEKDISYSSVKDQVVHCLNILKQDPRYRSIQHILEVDA